MSERNPMSRRSSFQPGQSGNPGGKPKTAEISALSRRYSIDAVTALVDVVRMRPAEHCPASAIVAAARALIDIGYPGLARGGAMTGEGNALHLHLLAVQSSVVVATGAHLTGEPAAESTIEAGDEAEAWISNPELAPPAADDLPDTALALWDAARARVKARLTAPNEPPTPESAESTPESAADAAQPSPEAEKTGGNTP